MSSGADLIPEHPAHKIIDSSKLTTFMSCHRKFFFRYLLWWDSVYPNNDLVFGSSYHAAMDKLYETGNPMAAYNSFLQTYRESFDEDTDEIFAPKDPTNALRAINMYGGRFFGNDMRNSKVLHREVAGRVLISDDSVMTFKLDLLLQDKKTNEIQIVEYKTSKWKYHDWADRFTNTMQVFTYLHALHCLFPDNDEYKLFIRCAFLSKNKKEPVILEQCEIKKTDDQMQEWLSRVNYWYNKLQDEMVLLAECQDTDPVLEAFPKNDTACFSYQKMCQFFDVCSLWPNPLQHCHIEPNGFVTVVWNPLESPEIKTTIDEPIGR